MGYMSQYGPYGTGAGLAAAKRRRSVGQKRKANFARSPAAVKRSRVGRRIPATTAVTQRRKTVQGRKAPHEWSVATSNWGRYKKPTLMRLYREVRSSAEATIFRFNGIKSFDDNGLFACGKQLDGAGQEVLPLYLYDLTGIMNTVNGTVTHAQPLLRASIQTSTGNVSFAAQQAPINTGASTSANIQLEKTGTNTSSVWAPHERGIFKWADVRMNLWGTVNKPTRFIVQLVKFRDDDLDPLNGGILAANAYNSFYQSLIKQMTFNPIATTNGNTTPKRLQYKVLKTYSVNMDPQQSIEIDGDPKCKTLRWFLKFDEQMDYRNRGTQLANGDDVTADEDFAVPQNQVTNTPEFRHRYYLMIRAAAYTRDPSTFPTVTNTLTPTFDLLVRTCHLSSL